MADLEIQAGRIQDVAGHLREGLQTALQGGTWRDVLANGLWFCALLCAATGRYAEAATAWAPTPPITHSWGAMVRPTASAGKQKR